MKQEDIPWLTQKDYHKNKSSLHGWFKTVNVKIDLFYDFDHEYALFKNGEIIRFVGKSSAESVFYQLSILSDNFFHTEDGPAVIKCDTPLVWTGSDFLLNNTCVVEEVLYYKDGRLHRLDGPAVVKRGRKDEYYIDNHFIDTKEEYFNHPEVILFKNKKAVLEIIKKA